MPSERTDTDELREARVLRVGLALALLVYLAFAARFWFACDDAFISFRYAKHLVEGHGLVYNTQESLPVEGYTNFGWVLWMSLAELVGLDPRVFANVTSIVCGAVLLFSVARTARRRFALHARACVAVALFFACLPPIAVWATGGLETMAFGLACFLAFERVSREAPSGLQAGLAALAAALLRADGLASVFLVFGAVSLGSLRSGARLRALALATGIAVLGVSLHVGWRYSYYHDFLPNTAYVKAGMTSLRLERGFNYAVVMFMTAPTIVLAPLAGLFVGPRATLLLRVQCALVWAGVTAYSVFHGGDWMPMGRFLVPAMPFVALSFAGVIAALWPSSGVGRTRSLALTIAALVLNVLPLFDLHVVPFSVRERFHFRWNDPGMLSEYERWDTTFDMPKRLLLAKSLARHTSDQDSMPLVGIGIVGYYTEIQMLDQCGLVSREVARRPASPVRASPGHDRYVQADFFLPWRPTIARAWLAAPGSELEEHWKVLVEDGSLVLETHPLPESERPYELRVLRFAEGSRLLER